MTDTRRKIVDSLPVEARQLKVIVGYFDPMHAAHARRLRELAAAGGRVVVFVADPAEPLLPLRARLELVAALDCVAYAIAGEGAPDLANILDERASDNDRTRDFTRHVVARHNAK